MLLERLFPVLQTLWCDWWTSQERILVTWCLRMATDRCLFYSHQLSSFEGKTHRTVRQLRHWKHFAWLHQAVSRWWAPSVGIYDSTIPLVFYDRARVVPGKDIFALAEFEHCPWLLGHAHGLEVSMVRGEWVPDDPAPAVKTLHMINEGQRLFTVASSTFPNMETLLLTNAEMDDWGALPHLQMVIFDKIPMDSFLKPPTAAIPSLKAVRCPIHQTAWMTFLKHKQAPHLRHLVLTGTRWVESEMETIVDGTKNLTLDGPLFAQLQSLQAEVDPHIPSSNVAWKQIVTQTTHLPRLTLHMVGSSPLWMMPMVVPENVGNVKFRKSMFLRGSEM